MFATASAPIAAGALLRACCLLMFLVAGSRQLSVTELVVPEAVEAGGRAELRCRHALDAGESALDVRWWWTPSGASPLDRKLIYQHIAGLAAGSVHPNKTKIKENDTLVLLDLKPSDSGTYQCEGYVQSNSAEERQHGVLIVYTKGSGPQLNISSVADGPEGGEDLLIECKATDVAPLPQLIVTMSNGDEINMTEVLTGPTSEGLYNIFANASRRQVDVEPGDLRCELHYENPNITHPQYIDIETYHQPAGDAPPAAAAELPAAASEPHAPESLPNSRDAGYNVQCSWALPAIAAILVHLHAIL